MVCRSERSEILSSLLAERPRTTPVYQGLRHLDNYHAVMRTFGVNGAASMPYMQLPLEPFVACPREWNPWLYTRVV